MSNKAYKIRLYPNKAQTELIDKTVGSVRFLFNQMLKERIDVYEKLRNDTEALKKYKYKTEKQYKQEYIFLSEVPSRALQQSRLDLDTAFKNFYRRIKQNKKQKGFPKFKKKSEDKWSYRDPQVWSQNTPAIEIKNNKIKLPKLSWVKFKGLDKNFSGKIKSVTIEKGRDDKYYASILVEKEKQDRKLRTGNEVTGIDLGLKEFVTLSNGEIINGIKDKFKELSNRIDKANKHLSRKAYGSNRYEKQRIKLNRLYKKRTNIQNHFFWHLSNHILSKSQAVVIEDLNVKGMVKNRRLSKAIHSVAWSSFIQKLKHKADEYGTDVFTVNRFFPSSKLCPSCGSLKENLTLKDRVYTCDCGYTQDRDINAAINLRNEYLTLYNVSLESSDYRCGETIRPIKIDFDLKGSFDEASINLLEKIA